MTTREPLLSPFYSNEDGDCWVLAEAAATEEDAANIAMKLLGQPVVAWGAERPTVEQFQDDEIGHVCGPDGCYVHSECATKGCPPPFKAEAWAFEEADPWAEPEGDRVYKPEGWKPLRSPGFVHYKEPEGHD